MPSKPAPKKKGWKENKKNIKSSKNIKLGITVLGFIVVLIILGQILNFIKVLINPLSFDLQREVWKGEFNISVIIQSDSIYLLNFNPHQEEATVVSIPDETYLDTSQGFGKERVGSIFSLGEYSKKGMGVSILKTAVGSLFSLPIDGYIRFENSSKKELHQIIDDVRQNPFSGISLIDDIKSDMTPLELIRLKLGLWKVRFDKIRHVDLLGLGVFDALNLANGTTVLVADQVKLDTALTDFLDPKIREENLSVAIFNATDYPLLAQKAKKMINNLGANVIIASNSPQKLKNTYILGMESKTLKRLNQIFLPQKNNLECAEDKCDNIDLNQISSRAQINIFLGEDFAKLN